jgi:xanthine dehydrogenase accessory factor
MSHDLDSVLAQAAQWKRSGLGVALATVVRTWGSSPRPAGSKLAVNERGEFVGSVSGGCIEGAVITEALEVMRGEPARVIDHTAPPFGGAASPGQARLVDHTAPPFGGAASPGQARLVEYGVSDEAAWEVGLACGGKVEILIEAVSA